MRITAVNALNARVVVVFVGRGALEFPELSRTTSVNAGALDWDNSTTEGEGVGVVITTGEGRATLGNSGEFNKTYEYAAEGGSCISCHQVASKTLP